MDIKEIIKRIKNMSSSVLDTNPTMPDTTSELVRQLGATNGTGDNKRPK